MPYAPDHAGQELAGISAGLIVSFSGEDNFDTLATCISDQDALTESMTNAVESLMSRYNEDIISSVEQMGEIMKTLD